MDLKIDHIGYFVRKIEKARVQFEKIGFKACSDLVSDDYRKIDILFMEKDGYVVELVSPTDRTTKIASLAKRVGNSPYHICYRCNNLTETISELENEGYVICDERHSAIAFDNREVCFLIHPYLGMVELLEE